MVVNKMQARIPFIYDFENWETFYTEVMGFHAATRRTERRVIDFIQTFRQFMSERVVEHLDVLVNLHPRFDTMDGWDDWVNNVTAMLHEYDPSLGRFSDVELDTPSLNMGCCASSAYTSWRKVLSCWSDLDMSVSEGVITSSEQREQLWRVMSDSQRAEIIAASEYVDPENYIWQSSDQKELKWAERNLCYTMTSILSHLTICRHRQMRFWKHWLWAFVFLSISSVLMNLATHAAHAGTTNLPFLFGAVTLALSFFTGARYFALRKEHRLESRSRVNRFVLKS